MCVCVCVCVCVVVVVVGLGGFPKCLGGENALFNWVIPVGMLLFVT